MGELIQVRKIQQDKTRHDLLAIDITDISRYEGDMKRFKKYCAETKQNVDCEALLNYLAHSIMEQRVKKSTWERRLAGVKKLLQVELGLTLTQEQNAQVKEMRSRFNAEEFKRLKHVKGQSALDKEEVMQIIDKLGTREKAICLVNLTTANRPSEMTRLQIKDFDLQARTVLVDLKKQHDFYEKRLTLEAVKAVKAYIREYKLQPDDFFVGSADRWGNYTSKQISETAYNKAIHKWLGFAPYSLRKTQVSSMHEKGADVSTIAKQTGHKSLETITNHYLKVSDSTVDKFL